LLILTTPYWGYFKNVAVAITNRALTALWDGGHIKQWSYRTLRTIYEEQGFDYVAFLEQAAFRIYGGACC
jgi:2-polyprenyl-6-hydroxyphenyl methylase/3-demethylubiquinone-9 3-methyltransferase